MEPVPPSCDPGKARDKVGEALGVSGKTVAAVRVEMALPLAEDVSGWESPNLTPPGGQQPARREGADGKAYPATRKVTAPEGREALPIAGRRDARRCGATLTGM